RRDRLQRIDDLARRMRTQLPVEQKGRESDGRQSDEGPKTLLPSFHALASVAWAVNRLKRWRPAGARRRSTAVGLRGSHRGQAAHAAEVEPDVGVVLRLPFEVGVAGGVPGADVVGEVVEDELAAIGLDGEDGMALALEILDDGHQQRLAREAGLDEQFALVERINLAVALAVDGIIPMVEHGAPMGEVGHRLDGGVDAAVDAVERAPGGAGHADVERLQLAEVAFLGPAAAEVHPAVRHGRRAADGGVAGSWQRGLGGLAETGEGGAEQRGGESGDNHGFEHYDPSPFVGSKDRCGVLATAEKKARNFI